MGIPNTSKCVIMILLDHSSPDVFFSLIDKGFAPYISKYILGEKDKINNSYQNAVISRRFVTGFPSTSMNSHISLLTGTYAGKNDVLYTSFWNSYKKIPQYIDTEKISIRLFNQINDKYINSNIKTLFEYIPNSVSLHAINRGAQKKLFTTWTLITKFLPFLFKMRKKKTKWE